MTEWTTLSIESDLRDELRAMKTGSETYTDVLRRQITQFESNEATESK